MKLGVPKEILAGEKRVATTPDVAGQLQKLGFDIAVESGAGAAANFSDDAFREAGCEIVGFVRMEVGEGIEKKEDDFAAEVAKAAQG